MGQTNELMKMADVVSIVGLSKSTIHSMVRCGTFPSPVKLGERCVRWKFEEVRNWLDSLPRADYSDFDDSIPDFEIK